MFVRDTVENDLHAILTIHNDAVRTTAAIWDLHPVDLDNRRDWLRSRQGLGYPVLTCEDQGVVLGYASFGDFRPRWGYRFSVEHSIYVAAAHRRRGAGRMLINVLVERAQAMGKHALVGGIEADNGASIALHAALGFEETARLPQVGAKFGRWLNLVFMVRLLDDHSAPID